jgi:hypothetical protein
VDPEAEGTADRTGRAVAFTVGGGAVVVTGTLDAAGAVDGVGVGVGDVVGDGVEATVATDAAIVVAITGEVGCVAAVVSGLRLCVSIAIPIAAMATATTAPPMTNIAAVRRVFIVTLRGVCQLFCVCCCCGAVFAMAGCDDAASMAGSD